MPLAQRPLLGGELTVCYRRSNDDTAPRCRRCYLQPVKRPFDRHIEKILAGGLVSAGGSIGVVHERMHVAKMALCLASAPMRQIG